MLKLGMFKKNVQTFLSLKPEAHLNKDDILDMERYGYLRVPQLSDLSELSQTWKYEAGGKTDT